MFGIQFFKTLLFLYVMIVGGSDISVMSYNIRYDNPNDGKDRWNNRRNSIVTFIQNAEPDIIGMQEVLHGQLQFISNQITDYSYIGVGRDDGKIKGEYSPIFYRKKTLVLQESHTFWLSETPDSISVGWDAALPRICTYARFEHKNTQKQFWVFNTHFDHRGEEARKQAADLILRTIKEVNKTQIPVILTGDFNLTPDTVPIQQLQQQMEDVMYGVLPSAKDYGTFNGFELVPSESQRIDYIFQKGFVHKKAKHLWIKTPQKRWASDHHPVYAQLKLSKK